MYPADFAGAARASGEDHPQDVATDSDFDTLLTDLLAGPESQALHGFYDDPSATLAMPWTTMLRDEERQSADCQQVSGSSQQQSSTGQSSSQTGAPASQAHRQPARRANTLRPACKSSKEPSKRSEAWILKNRRAQQKFRDKQRVAPLMPHGAPFNFSVHTSLHLSESCSAGAQRTVTRAAESADRTACSTSDTPVTIEWQNCDTGENYSITAATSRPTDGTRGNASSRQVNPCQ